MKNTTDLKAYRRRGYMQKPMRASAKGRRDPGVMHKHRAWRGPRLRAQGPGSYAEASPAELRRQRITNALYAAIDRARR